MITQEARQFVARFIKGENTPEEHEAFLRWLEEASLDQLEVIADEYEAFYEQVHVQTTGPSSEWVEQLERKLNKADTGEKEVPERTIFPNRFVKKIAWVAAASVLVAGAYWWISKRPDKEPGSITYQPEVLYKTLTTPIGHQ